MWELEAALSTHGWHVDVDRLFAPVTFAAAMLLPEHRVVAGWQRGLAAYAALDARDLTVDPLPEELLLRGQALAAITGVKPGALIGWHRVRWDWHMSKKLEQLGDDVLEAIVSAPGAPPWPPR